MIRSAYIAPTEFSIRSIDVKRALLTYDRVYLPNPGDRDLIPPQSFMAALGIPALGFNMGPVRPLGKSATYDNDFDQLIDELQVARRDGCVEIVSTYDLESSDQDTFGTVMMGDYPLNPHFMLHAYRSIASDPTMLELALAGDQRLMALTDEQIERMSVDDAIGDRQINDEPTLPQLQSALSRREIRTKLTAIARARIGSTMKSVGYCATKDLVPIFRGSNFDTIVGALADRATKAIDRVADEDLYWTNRRRVLDIAHDEYLNEEALARTPIEEILKLRSKIWGDQAEARDELLRTAAKLARDSLGNDDFNKAVLGKIHTYKKLASEVQRQRSALSFKIKCELFKAGVGLSTTAMAVTATSGAFSQMQTAMGAGTLLLGACLWTINKAQEIKPVRDQLTYADTEFRDNICFGIHNFYRQIATAVSS